MDIVLEPEIDSNKRETSRIRLDVSKQLTTIQIKKRKDRNSVSSVPVYFMIPF